MTTPLFYDEKTRLSPDTETRLDRIGQDYQKEVMDLQKKMHQLARQIGMNNVRLLHGRLLDAVEAQGDCPP